jgi:4-hydroxybutyrate CoA-transferase
VIKRKTEKEKHMGEEGEYRDRVVSFEQAAKQIRSGDTVATALALGAWSIEMVHAILNRYKELEGVTLMDGLQLNPDIKLYNEEFLKEAVGRISFCPNFGTVLIRKLHEKAFIDHFGNQSSDAGEKLGRIVDVFITQVTPPNRQGFVNLGLTNFYTMDTIRIGRALGKQRLTIGEVNDQQPIVYGNNWMHVSEFDFFVENSHPVMLFSRAEPGETERIIGKHVLELINDGDTFQMGFGTIPEAVVNGLHVKNDLSVHTEMFPTDLPELVREGVITNKRKPFHTGVTIASFCLGDEAMYEYVRENPKCEFYPGSYTNNPAFIAQHPNMVAINMGLLVDLSGQIVSEGIGHRMVSGPGGQLDFQIGAYYSKGGKGITLIKSARTLKNGIRASSIVPELPLGSPVTVPRHYVDYIITEYGIAHLRNKTRRQRAEALIEIAHPDFRDELRVAANKNFYPTKDY